MPNQDRYKLHDSIGAGGFGSVHRAYDRQLHRWVAVKRLAISEGQTAADLKTEADILATLRHPSIVSIYDVLQDETTVSIVMELLEGPDLSAILSEGPLSVDDFKQLAEQALEALLTAHEMDLQHRDIKPANIKIERLAGGRLQAKLIDFGLARDGTSARPPTADVVGHIAGSPFYMAPEQLSRKPCDARADLYALGCVFYEALSGRCAFEGKTMANVIDKHLEHDVRPLQVLCPHLPHWLTYWVSRLMAKDPADRPADAGLALSELRAWERLPAKPGGMTTWQPQHAFASPAMNCATAPLNPHLAPTRAFILPPVIPAPDQSPLLASPRELP